MSGRQAGGNAKSFDSVAMQLSDRRWEGEQGAIAERRRRIIREATRLIAQDGFEKFNLRGLAQRADVSLRTVFNAFQNRENVIALSIWYYFESFDRYIVHSTPSDTLAGAIERLVTTHLRARRVEGQMRATTALYFSPTAHPSIRKVMQDIGGGFFRGWLRAISQAGHLKPGVDVERLIVSIANAEYAVNHEWSLGLIPRTEFLFRLLEATLLLLSGGTTGDARSQIERLLGDLYNNGRVLGEMIKIARRHVKNAEAALSSKRFDVA